MVEFQIPRESREPLNISVRNGERLYLVGANGSGKSALVQHLVSSLDGQEFRRLPAFRQMWFSHSVGEITPTTRKQLSASVMHSDRNFTSIWEDSYADSKYAAAIFDLAQKEIHSMRKIGELLYKGKTKKAKRLSSKTESPLTQLNELLSSVGLLIQLTVDEDSNVSARHLNSSTPLGIEKMSDGERNAVIVAANVLTVDSGTILFIDEPERHLHRSIIQPLLSALFALRKDCPFVISTHDLALPLADSDANVISISSCSWKNDRPLHWYCRLLESSANLPEELRRAILGSRHRVLFVEGEESGSLDFPLYSALFPDISIVPSSSSGMVQQAVKGLRATFDQHEVEAFGLIDRDDRCDEQVEKLAEAYIFALDVYSVESLYYSTDSIEAVANRQAEDLDVDAAELADSAQSAAFDVLNQDHDLPRRMAARRCERSLRNKVQDATPSWANIMEKATASIEISIEDIFQKELSHFCQLMTDRNWDELLTRYPMRESKAFSEIANKLRFTKKEDYQQILVSRVRKDPCLARKLRQQIGMLFDALKPQADSESAEEA